MGHLPIKYLRFSLLVASVFIFAGSARASENKTTEVSVQTSGKVVINSSSSTSSTSQSGNQSGITTHVASPTPSKGSSELSSVTTSSTNSTSELINQKSSQDSEQIATNNSQASLATLSQTTATSSDSAHVLPDQNQVSSAVVKSIPTVQARLASSPSINFAGMRPVSNYYLPLAPSMSHIPSSPASHQSPTPILPMTQSEMLIASLSQLLLSPNIVQKIVDLSGLTADALHGVSGLIPFLSILAAIIAGVALIGSGFLTSLRKTGFWHGARSGELSAWNANESSDRGLVVALMARYYQTSFIDKSISTNRVLNTGGQL